MTGPPRSRTFARALAAVAVGTASLAGALSAPGGASAVDPLPRLASFASAGGTGLDRLRDLAADATGGRVIVGLFAAGITFGAGSPTAVVTAGSFSGRTWGVPPLAAGQSATLHLPLTPPPNARLSSFEVGVAAVTPLGVTDATPADDVATAYLVVDAGPSLENPPAPVWLQTGHGFSSSNGSVRAATSDAAGNVYLAGVYGPGAVFGTGPSAITPPASIGADVFIAKMAPDGTPIWVSSSGGYGTDQPDAIALDGAGNVYATGSYDPNRLTGWGRLGAQTTDAGGAYAFSVIPGTYRLRVIDFSGRFQRGWIRDGQTYRSADDIAVAPGAGVVVDAALSPLASGRITGHVSGPGSVPLPGISVLVLASNGWVAGATTGGNGDYLVTGSAPGAYDVWFVDPNHTYASQWFDHAPTHSSPARRPVIVTTVTATADAQLGP